ncbi:MAG: rod-binding protein [Planctomycetota bacterium]
MDVSFAKGAADAARSSLMSGRVSRLTSSAGEAAPDVAAREMESLFATMLVSELRKGMDEGFFGKGPGADTFNGWFDEQVGASLASQGSLGLADEIRESILREQHAAAAEEARLAAEGKGKPEGQKA